MQGVRFAPSPTGRFHIGNLRTAWVAHKISRALNEPFVVRVEDIDTARLKPEAWNHQLEDLHALGIIPDQIYFQTTRYQRHLDAFERARNQRVIYPCDCSRKDVAESLKSFASAPHHAHDSEPTDVPVYSGHCRMRDSSDLSTFKCTETLAWRWRVAHSSGIYDSIVARTSRTGKDFSPGYQWACAIDDADGDYRLLVRAWDLAPSEPIQLEIRKWLEPARKCRTFHTTFITRPDLGRLEKRSKGVTLQELLSSGTHVQTILSWFEKSFDLSLAMDLILNHRSHLLGEPIHSLSVDKLSTILS